MSETGWTKGVQFYAENGTVWQSPKETKNDDGSRSISIGFPVCTMHEAVGAAAAEHVAGLMNLGAAAQTRGEQ